MDSLGVAVRNTGGHRRETRRWTVALALQGCKERATDIRSRKLGDPEARNSDPA